MDLDGILRLVKVKGHRLTPQRRLILRVLADVARPRSAQQIHRRLAADFPGIGLDTVYRNLRLLVGLGLVNQITVARRRGDLFELSDHHHHHRLCLECGDVACLPLCPLDTEGAGRGEAAARDGFRVVGHVFEVYGYCRRCAAGAPEEENGGNG